MICRSLSVSRGLQVEEDDLIQFSDGQPVDGQEKLVKKSLKTDELEGLREGGADEEDAVMVLHFNDFVVIDVVNVIVLNFNEFVIIVVVKCCYYNCFTF